MKKILLLVAGVLTIVTLNAQMVTTDISGARAVEQGKYPGAQENDPINVLLIEDFFLWGCYDNLEVLTNLGATVTLITASEIAAHDFSPYCLIVIAGSITGSPWFNSLNANLAKFETFVNDGGTMEIHAWTQGEQPLNLPGGVQSYYNYDTQNNVLIPEHPIVAGIPLHFTGNGASHNYFINLAPGTQVITENTFGQTTTIEYTYGDGLVTASTCTYEAYYCIGGDIGTMMQNNLAYSVASCNTNPIPLTPWALAIAAALIVGFTLLRYRRSF